MILSETEIFNILSQLGVKHSNSSNAKGWVELLCPNPFHHDKNMGNAFINIHSGVVNCFSCGYKKHIFDVVVELTGKTKEEVIKEHNNLYTLFLKPTIPDTFEEKKEARKPSIRTDQLVLMDFDPEQFEYTKKRGYTKEFCRAFNIKRCLSNPYVDYFIIPISDSKLKMDTFEARKLQQVEEGMEFFKTRVSDDISQLVDEYAVTNNIVLRKGQLYKDDAPFFDTRLKYLLSPKVLYPSNSNTYQTLFNIDNLDRSKPLYVVEGMGSIAKIWQHISKNVTCTFGSNLDQSQVNYLREFKKVILIPDPDDAGRKMVNYLFTTLLNFACKYITADDTDDDYVNQIKTYPEAHPITSVLWG